ncbi:MAG: AIR synthase-related protein, partial [Sulfuricella sp.]|nr:AIR synthase-related protein [Sulfuricella sp.]
GSKLAAEVEFDRLPLLPAALYLAKKGYAPGAAARNWASYGHEVTLPATMPGWQRNMLCDPQTSGGLLVACAQEEVESVLEIFSQQGFGYASVIGSLRSGKPNISVK